MKARCLIFSGVVLLFSLHAGAQSTAYSKNSNQPPSSPPKESMTAAADSIKMAINDAKNSFSTLFKGHRDTTTIMISGIDYDDPGLSLLKESLKKVKGVRDISMEYKSSTALIKVPFKGKPTALWDQIDSPAKTPFKLVEAGDNELVLKVRNAANP